jgi:hypothetical protein
MASWTMLFLVKMMTFWNYLSALYKNTLKKYITFYFHITDYTLGYHDTWLFIPGHTFPLSLANLSNMIRVNWVYDNSDTSLIKLSTTDSGTIDQYKFSWLSAKIIVKCDEDDPIEYIIDEFLEKFIVHTAKDAVPSLYLVFMCWCAHTRHWFKINDRVEFHIIDDMAEEHMITLDDSDDVLIIKRNKVYLSDKDISVNNEETDCIKDKDE